MTIRVGCVGGGYWGPNLVRNIDANPKSHLSAICDVNSTTLRSLGARYPSARLYQSLDDMLADDSIEAVVIATPSGMHHAHARTSLLAQKHVFVEKPMAGSVTEALELLNLHKAGGRTLMVGHTFLYNNIVRDIKQRLTSGDLGKIYYAYSQRLNLGQFRRDSDVMWTLAPHDVSILNYWFDARPIKVSATGLTHVFKEEQVSDVCFCLLYYPDGRSAHLHLSWLDPQKTRQMVLVGDKKMLVYDDVDLNKPIQIYDKGVVKEMDQVRDFADFKTRLRAGDVVLPSVKLTEPLSSEMDHFLDCIRTGQRPMTDAVHGLEVVCVLEALTRSMQLGGVIVDVQYPEV